MEIQPEMWFHFGTRPSEVTGHIQCLCERQRCIVSCCLEEGMFTVCTERVFGPYIYVVGAGGVGGCDGSYSVGLLTNTHPRRMDHSFCSFSTAVKLLFSTCVRFRAFFPSAYCRSVLEVSKTYKPCPSMQRRMLVLSHRSQNFVPRRFRIP